MFTSSDFDALKTIPTIDIVRDVTRKATLYLLFKDTRAETFARIEKLEPDQRALIWLGFLDQQWGPEALVPFFLLYGGDFAPQVFAALRHAGLEREAAVFAEAMALFGPVYPLTEEERKTRFDWSKPGRSVSKYETMPNEPNEFHRALTDLGTAFGSQRQFAGQIAAFVERTPSLIAWTDAQRSKMTEQDRLDWLLRHLTVRNWQSARAEIAGWPKAYRQLFLLTLFNEEMLNGGVHQFFYNSSGDFAPDVVTAMREAGLTRHAEALQRAIDMFEKPYPTDRTLRLDRYFSPGSSDWDEKLNAFTGDVDDGEIYARMLAIAKHENILPR